jgi:hypothetical protein
MVHYNWPGNDALSYTLTAREMDTLRTLYQMLDGVAVGFAFPLDNTYMPMRLSRFSLGQIFETYAKELGGVLKIVEKTGYKPSDDPSSH